jgi:hypothetical protein
MDMVCEHEYFSSSSGSWTAHAKWFADSTVDGLGLTTDRFGLTADSLVTEVAGARLVFPTRELDIL